MLGVCDKELKLATEKLASAGFVREHWSFSSPIDPATVKNDKRSRRIQETIRPAFASFDSQSIWFYYLDMQKYV